ncbi:hypothetical protein ONS95_004119 [Cadophora gregata]|uniref:uncharacterized protein n=1 Tax=Cadophora gregata TaxID=51156 RepID=UPI0026DBF59D|nr:uncharacterized protein ONS95_004119 [Cadophora gregata]KAK0105520.1 hypothetical protein ONS96_004906 [Cadophora gregata f. sp. sojae]KAK0105587.1 hypothetical protein ONS95_004119 [Cadophora gregata]
MVAIHSLVSMLALAFAASAAPTVNIEARQSSIAGLKFFAPDNHECEKNGDPFIAHFNVFTPPAAPGQHVTGVCYDGGSYGSLFVENINAPCKFQKHISNQCVDNPIETITVGGCNTIGAPVEGYWKIVC